MTIRFWKLYALSQTSFHKDYQMVKWYEVKEQAAGNKRLMLLWYIYNIAGKNAVKFIVFFVTLFAFSGAPKIRKCSQKYLKIANGKGSILSAFKHFLSYSYSLVDKMEMFTDKYSIKKIYFSDEDLKNKLFSDLLDKKGIYFLCSHLGNINAMRTFFRSGTAIEGIKVNLFLEANQCKTFKDFISKISTDNPITAYPVENIDMTTSIEIKEKLDDGEIVFMAGDRIAPNNDNAVFTSEFLSKKVNFPIGAFKFGLLTGAQIYFIVCTKEKNDKYAIHIKKFEFEGKRKEKLEELEKQYVKFLEELTKKYPYQFYHFYDFFEV